MLTDRKSQGIYVEEWLNQVSELLKQNQTLFPIDKKELEKLFHLDYGVEEVLWKNYVKGNIRAFMVLHVKHEYGEFNISLPNREMARSFLAKFTEVSKALD